MTAIVNGHVLNWTKPEPHVYAGLRRSGLRAAHVLAGVEPAGRADCSDRVSILDQLNLGSCTANAIAQIIRAEMLRTGAPPGVEFASRLWLYSLATAADGNCGQDVGTNLATVIDQAADQGFCKESLWPYDVATFGHRPSLECDRAAFDQRAQPSIAYHQISEEGAARLFVIKQALTTGKLVAFGTQVTEQFCSTSPVDVVTCPSPKDPIAGGHALTVAGYEPDSVFGERYLIANSWSREWGNDGFFWMSPSYLAWFETSDLWLVTRVPMFSGEA